MSSSRIERGRKIIVALALAAALASGLTPASASEARSSPEDRQRFLSVMRNLEQAPLKKSLKPDRAWAMEWLINAPDISVTLCAEPLGGVETSEYRYAGEILTQQMFSMAAVLIEHPEKANDPVAQQMAGVEGALVAYRAILREKPEAKSPALETALQSQARGELPAFVRQAWIRCSAKK
jgi:hypothetical protein